MYLVGHLDHVRPYMVEFPSSLGKRNEKRNSDACELGNGERKWKALKGENLRKKNKKIKYLIIFMGMVPLIEHLFHPKGNIHICYCI